MKTAILLLNVSIHSCRNRRYIVRITFINRTTLQIVSAADRRSSGHAGGTVRLAVMIKNDTLQLRVSDQLIR